MFDVKAVSSALSVSCYHWTPTAYALLSLLFFSFVFSFLSPSGICFGISFWRKRHGGFSDLMCVTILIAPLFVISLLRGVLCTIRRFQVSHELCSTAFLPRVSYSSERRHPN